MKTVLTLVLASAAAVAVPAASDSAAPPVKGKAAGRILYDGKPPELKPLQVTDEKAKGCVHHDHKDGKVDTKDPSLLVGKEGGIANVVVTIDVKGAELEVPEEALQLDQKECSFVPHVRIVPVGAKVVFLNSDEISHNVHTYTTKNEAMNKTIAPGSKEEQVMKKDDKVQVKCDIHDWMSAWIFVTDTPFHALTDEDGSFTIEGLEPGKYKVDLWHETLGKGKGEVVIKDDGTSEPIEIKLTEKKKGK